MLREFLKALNKHADFLKHADRDPDAVLEDFNEESNDLTLLIATHLYQSLTGATSPTMNQLLRWMMAQNSHFWVAVPGDPVLAMAAEAKKHASRLSRQSLLEVGLWLLKENKLDRHRSPRNARRLPGVY
jgi:hypothetical protein